MIPRCSDALALGALLFLTSCSGQEGSSGKLKIGMMPKRIDIPYFDVCDRGAREAAKELGVDLDYNGPLEADSTRQIEMLNSWVLLDYDVIAVAPNNPEAIGSVLKKARSRGIHVLTWDTDSASDAREYFCNQIDDVLLARTLVDIVVEGIGEEGTMALISGTETAANQNTWIAHMRTYIAERYPKLKIFDPIYYPGERHIPSVQAAAGLLRRPDRPDALVGMTSVAAPAAAKAVSDAGLSGKVTVTGLTLPSEMRPFVKDGTVKKFVLWKPADLGYLTVHAAKALAEGTVTEGKLAAGRLGELVVRNGQIILGEPLVFDASNIDDHDF